MSSPDPFEHLCGCEPVLGALVKAHGPLDEEARRRGRPDDAYGALLRAIVGQQLSVKAARTIYDRLCALYGDRTVYGRGLDLASSAPAVPVGPGCRVCARRDCAYREEEAFIEA